MPDTRGLVEQFRRLPQHPRPITRRLANWPVALQSMADYMTHAPEWLAHLRGRVQRYPAAFAKSDFEGADGVRLSAQVGVQRDADGTPLTREGILLVPGMFTSKHMPIPKARARRIFNELGYHVMTMDLRGFGESERAACTAGWKEALDVAAAVEYFRSQAPLERLHIYGESLGAAAVLVAAGQAGRKRRRLVDGSILAVCPHADTIQEVDYLDGKPVLGDEFFMVQWFFHQLLRLSGSSTTSFREYLDRAAGSHGLQTGQMLRSASPSRWVRHVREPTLIIMAEDDIVVPSTQAKRYQRALRGRRNPALWRVPWGNHCLFEMADPTWFWTVLDQFFHLACALPSSPAPTPP